MASCSTARRLPKVSAVVVTITPFAICVSRLPVTSITPQPVRESPGSKPAMRMVATCSPRESLARVSVKDRARSNSGERRYAADSFSISASLSS